MHDTTTSTEDQAGTRSVLASLRQLAPARAPRLSAAIRVAELQAAWLLALHGIDGGPVPADIATDHRRIAVEYDPEMPAQASGASDWDYSRRQWVITINGRQQATRQRFTLFHEYKHILDHGGPRLLDADRQVSGRPASEFLADYFAGCVLMPRALLKRAWANGRQTPADLALLFDVSERAIEVRLSQVGLVASSSRCDVSHVPLGAAA